MIRIYNVDVEFVSDYIKLWSSQYLTGSCILRGTCGNLVEKTLDWTLDFCWKFK